MRYGGDVEEMPCQDGQQTHAHARGCGGLTCLAASCDAAETTYSSAGAARPRGRRRAPGDPPLECQMLHSPHTPVASWEAAPPVLWCTLHVYVTAHMSLPPVLCTAHMSLPPVLCTAHMSLPHVTRCRLPVPAMPARRRCCRPAMG